MRYSLISPHACGWLLCLAATAGIAHAQPAGPGNRLMQDMLRCHTVVHGAPEEALRISDQLLATPSLSVPVEIGAVGCRGFALQLLGRGDDSLVAVERLRTLVKDPSLPIVERNRGLNLASILMQRNGRTEEGLGLLEEMLQRSVAENDVGTQITALTGIALVRGEQMDDPEGALRYLSQAIQLSEHLNRVPMPADVGLHYNYGYALLKLKRYDEAGKAFARAEAVANRVPDQDIMLYRIRGHRAEILRAQGRSGAARKELLSVLAWQKTTDAVGQVVTLQRLARIELEQRQLGAALDFANQAMAVAEPAKFDQGIRDSLELLAEINLALGDAARARDYLRQARQLDQGQMKGKNLSRLAELQAKAEQALDPAKINALQDVSSDRLLRNAALLSTVALLIGSGALYLRLRRQQRRLRQLEAVDPLTGLPNRREAERLLDTANVKNAAGSRSALLLVEIENFRALNDEHGHLVGDLLLKAVAGALREAIDPHDALFRWEGATFLLLRQDSSHASAFTLAAHLCRHIERMPVEVPPDRWLTPTVSIGVSSHPQSGVSRPVDSVRVASRCLQVARRNNHGSWAGLWRLDGAEDMDTDRILHDPEQALAQGWVVLGSDRPVSWSPRRTGSEASPTPIAGQRRQ
ncbi:MAG: diguanylate cyclase domain-containing protein [Stenotrophomonas sp.]